MNYGGYMVPAFWSNTIWYILLGILCIIQLIFGLKKANNRKHMLAVFFIISGMTFSFEAIIFLFLKSYNYYPMIIPQSPIDDGLAGSLFSQFSVSSSAMLISVLNLNYYWFLIFSVMYGIIEELFLHLGIYAHNWYQTWMTMLGLVLLFWIAKRMYAVNFKHIRHSWRYIFMMFGLFTLHMPTILWPSILLGVFAPSTKILPDAMSSYALICLINLFLMSFTCMIIYFSKLKWWWNSIVVLALFGIIYIAYRLNIIYVKEGLLLIFATIDIFGMYLCVFILDKLIINDERSF